MKLNSYNSLARIYDALVYVVFRNALLKSESAHNSALSSATNILVVGGGTGRMLPDLLRYAPKAEITFIDSSSKMLDIARSRVPNAPNVRFIHALFEDQALRDQRVDVVIANFFLDQYSDADTKTLATRIHSMLGKGGLFIVSDFIAYGSGWKKWLLDCMYVFFRTFGAISVRTLPNWKVCVESRGFEIVEVKRFYKDFIHSVLFKKKER